MGRFDESVVTASGLELLDEHLLGRALRVVSAYTGTGTVDGPLLPEQTDLVEQKQKAVIAGVEDAETGKRIRVQISNAGLAEGYLLHQILFYAALENEDEAGLPFVIMQDRTGVSIPAESEWPGFELEIYCLLVISGKLQISVAVDPAGTMKLKDLQNAMAEHDQDPDSHADIREALEKAGSAQSGNGPPSGALEAEAGDRYFDGDTGNEYVCTGVNEEGETIWKRVAYSEQSGNGPPSGSLEAEAGDRYFDGNAGDEYVCTGVNEENETVWKRVAYSGEVAGKQDKIEGQPGQIPVFGEDGTLEAQDFSSSTVFKFEESDWGIPASTTPEENAEAEDGAESEADAEYDGAYGYEIVIPAGTHKRKNGDFCFQVFHLVDGSYVTNTWAAFGTGVEYGEETGSVTLHSNEPYAGKILFVG